MSVWFWIALIAIGIPTIIVASFPFHAVLVRRRSRRTPGNRPADPITVIVPVKGLDEGRADALQRMTAQRTDGSIEWLFCLEDESDPSVPALRALAARAPSRIRVLITGYRHTGLHQHPDHQPRAHGQRRSFWQGDGGPPPGDDGGPVCPPHPRRRRGPAARIRGGRN